ncbi:MAG: YkgJ family cysteine cluster protein [Candidatus Marinimicrobia bacterium]|nr:YkgJ family cysteine cluster protein [Candidatus Neomarinimicrobiota bacterium]MBT3634091.1 YkgJ family cysteine cluster protein [Candidatus Neomarinimicrobiota bacterium]MBT3683035.1 YkgJ family cysteine cluster protein [Candidatus Neomarinimicrobiota bacterium]MBT3759873.1 YkgJ family cysteine cluster protein [Candidatus Neomarinimicrobiota bacterium]MBT3895674.1 YkgJ family cysteine cluster protein [Candidatus Neomarinimicrobiota bacterium]
MKSRFYDNGLNFECTGCGKCCEYSDAEVYLTESDVDRICNYLTITLKTFIKTYCRTVKGKPVLKSNKTHCIFLNDKRCKIYPVRPDQCRTFPFWGEILKSKSRWDYVGETCEGINQGKLYTFEEIRNAMKSKRDVPGIEDE